MVTHFQVAAQVKRNQDFSVIHRVSKDTLGSVQSVGKIALGDFQFKEPSVANPNLMEEERATITKAIVKARMEVQDLAISGVFCGIQSVEMASTPSLVAFAHQNAQITWQTSESPALRNRQGGVLEDQ